MKHGTWSMADGQKTNLHCAGKGVFRNWDLSLSSKQKKLRMIETLREKTSCSPLEPKRWGSGTLEPGVIGQHFA